MYLLINQKIISLIVSLSLLAILLCFFLIKVEVRKKKLFLTKIVYSLMQKGFKSVEHQNRKPYDLKFSYNQKEYFMKIFEGGNKKGLVMTNKNCVYLSHYNKENGPCTKNEICEPINKFLKSELNGIKVILIKNNILRMSKYINENEIVAIKHNISAFGTYFVREDKLEDFLDFVIKQGDKSNEKDSRNLKG